MEKRGLFKLIYLLPKEKQSATLSLFEVATEICLLLDQSQEFSRLFEKKIEQLEEMKDRLEVNEQKLNEQQRANLKHFEAVQTLNSFISFQVPLIQEKHGLSKPVQDFLSTIRTFSRAFDDKFNPQSETSIFYRPKEEEALQTSQYENLFSNFKDVKSMDKALGDISLKQRNFMRSFADETENTETDESFYRETEIALSKNTFGLRSLS